MLLACLDEDDFLIAVAVEIAMHDPATLTGVAHAALGGDINEVRGTVVQVHP